MPKKQKLVSVHIYGIFDIKKQQVTKVSLDEEDIMTDVIFLDEKRFSMCEFDVVLELD